jgi:hypothetical protein
MNFKKIIFLLIFITPFIGSAQDLSNWQVGVNINPFIFTQFSPDFYPEKKDNKYPNGFGFGLTIEKNWNESWGFKTGFESTKQNEKYFVNDNSADNTHIKASFEYYKVPLTIQYFYPLKEKLFLTFNQGIQFSFLKYTKIVEAGNYQIKTYTSDYYEYIFYDHPENNQIYYGKDKGHNENLFGIIGSIGVKGFLSKKISYSTNLRYEYDFTDADNFSYYKNGNTRPTHNFRLGLELGLQYHFSLGGCSYCKNQPH